MADLLAAVRDFNEKIRALLNAHDKGAFTAIGDAQALMKASDDPDFVYQTGLRRQLQGKLERLRTTWLMNDRPERKEVVELQKDPLSTETRATRRNVGILAILAVVMAIAGKAPTKVPGAEIAIEAHQWLFPLLLALVIVYEYNAFRIYARSDMARRREVEIQATGYLTSLKQELAQMDEWKGPFVAMASKLREEMGEGLLAALDKEWVMIRLKWQRETEDLKSELAAEDGRGRWDVHPPLVLSVISFVALVVAGVRIYRTEGIPATRGAIGPYASAQPITVVLAPPSRSAMPPAPPTPCVSAPVVVFPTPSASVSVTAHLPSVPAVPSAVPLQP